MTGSHQRFRASPMGESGGLTGFGLAEDGVSVHIDRDGHTQEHAPDTKEAVAEVQNNQRQDRVELQNGGTNVGVAEIIKRAVNIPVIVVGGIKSIDEINDIINNKKADFVSMCRPFIIEPNIIKKFKNSIQTKSKCINCNICAIAQEERPIKCYYGKVK